MINKDTKKYIIIVSSVLLLTPLVTFAALFNKSFSSITELINILIGIMNQMVSIVAALALMFFFWGLANFILHSGDEAKRSEGKNIMVWGIVALFVMVSVWGLVKVLQNTFL